MFNNDSFNHTEEELIELACNASTPVKLLDELAKHGSTKIKKLVARNFNTSIETLYTLEDEKDIDVSLQIIWNEQQLPNDFILKLARSKFSDVREELALRKDLGEQGFRILAKDYSRSVRANVASNTKTPLKTLQKLAVDKDPFVRQMVAKNPNTPQHILRILSQDTDPFVVEQAENILHFYKKSE